MRGGDWSEIRITFEVVSLVVRTVIVTLVTVITTMGRGWGPQGVRVLGRGTQRQLERSWGVGDGG